MRPSILFPLFADMTSLKGVGGKMAAFYERLCGGKHVVDLLWHLPAGEIDRRYRPVALKYADRDRVATLVVTIAEHAAPKRKGLPYRIIGYDDTGQITINYFNFGDNGYLGDLYPPGQKVAISGMLERFQGGWAMNHPDYAVPADRIDEIPALEAVYPLTEGLSGRILRRTIAEAMKRLPTLPEWLDPHLLQREGWTDWQTSVKAAHDPASAQKAAARRRLAYDELLADQLALAVIRRHHHKSGGLALPVSTSLLPQLEGCLPFAFTNGQRQAIAEIAADMASSDRMLRLLQGDVGSGKTVVALAAMLQAVEGGAQAAMMAPTDILARQHYARLSSFLEPMGMRVGLLTGSGKGRSDDRTAVMRDLADGTLRLVVGTHALFQDDVQFHRLGLAVVDEQHRFGVRQRLQLADKGNGVNVLVMTATPIPRTLALTAYGDMDVSRIPDKPPGRRPIDTRVINADRVEEVIGGVKRMLAQGAQAYWVCPLIDESEKLDLQAATQRTDILTDRLCGQFGENAVKLMHGRMSADEKEAVMSDFIAGKVRVLVATTVIEVGVDVPAATLMVIEHAERFGLAQLHQLRGRVGRGGEQSTCILLYKGWLNSTAKARLQMLRQTEDGFRIAEEDLRLRGAGELLGTRQSGLPLFRLSGEMVDSELLSMAHDDAALILSRDPELCGERSAALRTLLYLFEKDAAVKLFRA